MTVTAALNQSEARSMTVVAFTGAASSLAGAASAIANAASGAPTGSVLITRDNSLVFAVGVDWDSPRTMVPGPSQTSINQYTPTVGDTYWVQRSNTAIPAAGTNVTMSDTYTAPMTDRWNLAVIEIRVP
jgi:hypothetical protein